MEVHGILRCSSGQASERGVVTACDDDESTIDAVMQQGAIASANAVVVVSEVIDPALMAAGRPPHACQPDQEI